MAALTRTQNILSKPLLRRLRNRFTKSAAYKTVYLRRIRSTIRRKSPFSPLAVYIEPTNLCNSDCLSCPRKTMTRKKGIMEMGLFKKIVDECAQLRVRYAILQMFGEPFMDPSLLEKARYVKSKGLKSSLYTNGSLITAEKASAMVAEDLFDHMVVSIDGVDVEEYRRNRPKLKLQEVEENFDRLLRERQAAGKKWPSLNVHCTHLSGRDYSVQAFMAKWQGRADRVTVTPTHTWAGQLPGIPPAGNGERKFPCFLLWYQTYILWDGSVTYCSVDFDARNVIGNVRNQTLQSIWEGNFMQTIRNKHLEGGMNEYPLCRECAYSLHDKTWWWRDPVKVLF